MPEMPDKPTPPPPGPRGEDQDEPTGYFSKMSGAQGPSRDMIGGPWLGLIAFLVVAVGTGWVVVTMMQGRIQQAGQRTSDEIDHAFTPEKQYVLKRGLIYGTLSVGDPVVIPGKNDLPPHTPFAYTWHTLDAVRDRPRGDDTIKDVQGVVEPGTHVRFQALIHDEDNAQTHFIAMVEILDGPYRSGIPVKGMYLQEKDKNHEGKKPRYVPRADIFAPVGSGLKPLQSPTR